MNSYTFCFVTSFLFLLSYCSYGAETDTFRVHADNPYLGKADNIYLDIFCSANYRFRGSLNVVCYKISSDNDSILVLSKRDINVKFRRGVNKLKENFSKEDTFTKRDRRFAEVMKRANTAAPGRYKMRITVCTKDAILINTYFREFEVDSILADNSPLEQKIKSPFLKNQISMPVKGNMKASNKKIRNKIEKTKKKRSETIRRAGFTSLEHSRNGVHFVDLYFEDWFAGRYEVANESQEINDRNSIQFNSGLPIKNELGSPSLFSQYKANNKRKKNKEDIRGVIGMSTYLSSGQEQNSMTNNNYYELRGDIEVPVMGIPIDLQGLYTSQDKDRKVKSSYFRIHYDVDKVKEALKQSVGSYNNKFNETRSKNIGMQQIYRSTINNLETQKAQLEQTGSNDDNGVGSEAKKDKIADLSRKIDKYKALLVQTENTNFFDSAIVYTRTKDLENTDNISTKKILKKGSELFPNGKANKFISGVTKFDAGMFSKDGTKFTTGSQMMKGIDAGYDIGVCEIGGTVGKTEYIGRDGNLDKYTCYSGTATFRPDKLQKVEFIYYGYMPDRKMMEKDAFFSRANISAPEFSNPVHIVSLNYEGAITKHVHVSSEAASSFRQNDDQKIDNYTRREDNIAYQVNAEGNIPNSNIALEGSYNKTGIAFENSTLPVSLSGTELIRMAGRSDFFKSFITLGLEFNRMKQNNFNYAGGNTKWGFDIKTNSKRYPSVSLSYKPFATFRSYTDTLSVPQKPLLGSVWTGKLTYQLKHQKDSWRFSVLLNECKTIADTTEYGNRLVQASCFYNTKKWGQSFAGGRMEMYGGNTSATMPARTDFLSLSTNYTLNRLVSLTCGQDIGWAAFGLSRIAPNCGITCQIEKVPLNIRLCLRYNRYQLNETDGWKEIHSGNVDITYRIKPQTPKNLK